MKLLEKLFGSDDFIGTRLELARTFADLGGEEIARDLLSEVIDEGNDDQRRVAETLVAELA